MRAMKAAVAFLDLSLHFESSQPKLTVILACLGRTFKFTHFLLSLLFILLPCLYEIKPMTLMQIYHMGKLYMLRDLQKGMNLPC